MEPTPIRPVFVVGSPRSGTTLIGSWLASDPEAYDVGEYNAFYSTHRLAPAQMRGVQPPWWRPHLEQYLADLREHAAGFIERVARDAGCDSYVDSSPRNLLIADELADRFPDALFVLMLRHYSGVVQSLGRTNWPWVPGTAAGKADVWAEAYGEIDRLPRDRTVVISYDALCASPADVLADVAERLTVAGIRVARLDAARVFGYSHAHVLGQPRETLGDAGGELHPLPSVDMVAWTAAVHEAVAPHVAVVDERLRREFDEYVDPAGWSTPSLHEVVRPGVEPSPVAPVLASAEFIVENLARAEEFLVDLMGFQVVQRSRHAAFDADLVLLDAGSVSLSVLCPTEVGDAPPFPAVEPKLAHLTFLVESERDLFALRARLVEAGAAVAHSGPHMFHLPAAFMEAVFGASPAFVVVQVASTEAGPTS